MMSQKNKWPGRRALPVLFLAIAAALVALVMYAGRYNFPCPLDDFNNALWDDLWQLQRNHYLHWSGRYFSNLVVALTPLHWHSLEGYRLTVIVVIFLFVLANALLVCRALKAF